MATLKCNGGVFRYLDLTTPTGTTRVAVCRNGQVLRKVGEGWKRWKQGKPGWTPDQIAAELARFGFVADTSGRAVGMQTRTHGAAVWHDRAIADRRARQHPAR